MRFLNIFLILIIFSQSETIILNCKYDRNSWIILDPYYMCKATVNLSVDPDQSKATGVTGKHEPGKTNQDVIYLDIGNQHLQLFPEGIEKIFPNLKAISAYHNKIKSITKYDLKAFPGLEFITFQNNDIMTLHDDLFTATPNLNSIGFHFNKISHIGFNTFKPLKNLKKLLLQGGKNCVDESANTLEEVKSLISKLPDSCPPSSETFVKDIWKLYRKNETIELLEKKMETRFKMSEQKIETKINSLTALMDTNMNTLKSQMDTKLDSMKSQIEYLVKKIENVN